MKKILALLVVTVLLLTALTACGSKSSSITIAVPNDATNEARALLLLQDNGYIKLKDGAGITATINDIAENPKNITFNEVEAAQVPNVLKDVDYAIINSNYAIPAGLNPTTDSLLIEGSASAYGNVLVVKEGNEETDKIKALKAAVASQQVADYITETYGGAVVSVVENPGNGYDDSVDYDALAGTTITVAATPTPHAEVLSVAKEILAAKDITLDIKEFTDYVQPNNVVESGEIDANYFQHTPYLDDFNEKKGTDLVAVAAIHSEPFGIYPGTKTALSDLADGDVIAVPNDTTNEARALLLLQDNGVIKLADGAGLAATVKDIVENPHNVKIQELEAAQVSRVKDEVAFVVLNGNYALQAGFSVAHDAVAYETSASAAAKTYANVLVVKAGNENNEGIQAVVKVLKSDEIKQFINDTYDGAVIPFED